MEVPKKKTGKKDLSPSGKNMKTQDHLPKVSWPAHTDDTTKTQWNPSALYF